MSHKIMELQGVVEFLSLYTLVFYQIPKMSAIPTNITFLNQGTPRRKNGA
jgi:hypothetical protein